MPDDANVDRLRLDYGQTTDLLRTLTDVRFKLLAFVPTISGAAVALLSRGASAAELLVVGLLGLIATVGVVLYDLRNTEIYDYAMFRAQALEAELGMTSLSRPSTTGGLFTERPPHTLRVFGFATAAHDRALALVYSAAIGGWNYLVFWGFFHALHVSGAQALGSIAGVIAGFVTLLEFLRIDGRPNAAAADQPTAGQPAAQPEVSPPAP